MSEISSLFIFVFSLNKPYETVPITVKIRLTIIIPSMTARMILIISPVRLFLQPAARSRLRVPLSVLPAEKTFPLPAGQFQRGEYSSRLLKDLYTVLYNTV